MTNGLGEAIEIKEWNENAMLTMYAEQRDASHEPKENSENWSKEGQSNAIIKGLIYSSSTDKNKKKKKLEEVRLEAVEDLKIIALVEGDLLRQLRLKLTLN